MIVDIGRLATETPYEITEAVSLLAAKNAFRVVEAAYWLPIGTVEAWTASLSAELTGLGITVNVVVPGGPTDTPMVPPESGYDRTALIRPEQMAPPMLYLFSDEANEVTGRRFVAAHWDPSLSAAQAAFRAGAPAAWPDLARSPVWPGGRPAR